VVEHLPSKCKAVSSNPRTVTEKKRSYGSWWLMILETQSSHQAGPRSFSPRPQQTTVSEPSSPCDVAKCFPSASKSPEDPSKNRATWDPLPGYPARLCRGGQGSKTFCSVGSPGRSFAARLTPFGSEGQRSGFTRVCLDASSGCLDTSVYMRLGIGSFLRMVF
jgi:hypothetical protein